jgi:hypothetical protein
LPYSTLLSTQNILEKALDLVVLEKASHSLIFEDASHSFILEKSRHTLILQKLHQVLTRPKLAHELVKVEISGNAHYIAKLSAGLELIGQIQSRSTVAAVKEAK